MSSLQSFALQSSDANQWKFIGKKIRSFSLMTQNVPLSTGRGTELLSAPPLLFGRVPNKSRKTSILLAPPLPTHSYCRHAWARLLKDRQRDIQTAFQPGLGVDINNNFLSDCQSIPRTTTNCMIFIFCGGGGLYIRTFPIIISPSPWFECF